MVINYRNYIKSSRLTQGRKGLLHLKIEIDAAWSEILSKFAIHSYTHSYQLFNGFGLYSLSNISFHFFALESNVFCVLLASLPFKAQWGHSHRSGWTEKWEAPTIQPEPTSLYASHIVNIKHSRAHTIDIIKYWQRIQADCSSATHSTGFDFKPQYYNNHESNEKRSRPSVGR